MTKKTKTKDKQLSTKQRIFIEERMKNGWNGKQAAISAGYVEIVLRIIFCSKKIIIVPKVGDFEARYSSEQASRCSEFSAYHANIFPIGRPK